jgi:hypothetical protein
MPEVKAGLCDPRLSAAVGYENVVHTLSNGLVELLARPSLRASSGGLADVARVHSG